MKKELLQIIEAEINNSKLKEDVMIYAEELIDFYEKNRSNSKEKFKQTLDKYNFETMDKFSEYSEYPSVTLFHGSGSLEFWPVLDYEGGVTGRDEEIGVIITEPTCWLDESKYEEPLQDEAVEWNWGLKDKIVFVWFATIWQEIKGYDYGILTKTLENNSARQFVFNDMHWDNLSEYTFYNNKDQRLEPHFEGDLTIIEIYNRVSKGS